MRICGLAAQYLHGESEIREAFPFERLQAYWTNAENVAGHQGHSQRRISSGAPSEDELPPPPYYFSQSRRSASTSPLSNRSSLLPPRGPRSRPLPPLPIGAGLPLQFSSLSLDNKITYPDSPIGNDSSSGTDSPLDASTALRSWSSPIRDSRFSMPIDNRSVSMTGTRERAFSDPVDSTETLPNYPSAFGGSRRQSRTVLPNWRQRPVAVISC